MGIPISIIGVYPQNEFIKRKNLFTALQTVFPIGFRNFKKENASEYYAGIFFSSDRITDDLTQKPSLHVLTANRQGESDSACFIKFTDNKFLDSRLRNKKLNDHDYVTSKPLIQEKNDAVLATVNDEPFWVKRRINSVQIDIVSSPMDELESGESLRTYTYRSGIFPLISLVHFLRKVTGEQEYITPRIRASFIIDDVNIRTSSYGAVKFNELVKLAEQHNFHVSLALIPIDLRRTSKSSVSLLREKSKFISMAIHGNNHTSREMTKDYPDDEEYRIVDQILDRVSAFEKKTGLRMSRVLIPPHGNIKPKMLGALDSFEFDAVCVSSQFPYLKDLPKDMVIPEKPEIMEWYPSDCISGMHIIPRRFPPLSKGEILLAAYLNHPIIVRYHPKQLVRGYDNLLRKARYINSLGEVAWTSLSEIAGSNYYYRMDGNTLRLRTFSNMIKADVPSGTQNIIIETAVINGLSEQKIIMVNGRSHRLLKTSFGYESEPIPAELTGRSTFTVGFNVKSDSRRIVPLRFHVLPYVRRFVTEMVDRSYPWFH